MSFLSGPQPKLSTKSRKQQFLELDFIGIALHAAGLTSILLGLSWGGTISHSWKSTSVIAPIVLGAIDFIASFAYDFVVVERTRRHALFPREMLSRFPEFTASLSVIFIAAWSVFRFFGAGPFGLITVVTVLNASLHVRPSELGIAVGLLGTFRSMGGSIGNAIFGAILRSVAGEELPRHIIAAAVAHNYKGDLTALITAVINAANGVPNAFASVTGVTPALEEAALQAYQQAYAQAYRMVFFSTIPFGVLAIFGGLFIRYSTKYMTNHVYVHLEKDVMHKTHRAEDSNVESTS